MSNIKARRDNIELDICGSNNRITRQIHQIGNISEANIIKELAFSELSHKSAIINCIMQADEWARSYLSKLIKTLV
jgi:hypothetical protein